MAKHLKPDTEEIGPTLEQLGVPPPAPAARSRGHAAEGMTVNEKPARGMAVNEEPSALRKYWNDSMAEARKSYSHDVPDWVSPEDRERFGSAWQRTGAAAEGALRGATFGLSDKATDWIAEEYGKPEYVRERELRRVVNPWTEEIANDIGQIATAHGGGGFRGRNKPLWDTTPARAEAEPATMVRPDWRKSPRPTGAPRKIIEKTPETDAVMEQMRKDAEAGARGELEYGRTRISREPEPFLPPPARTGQDSPTRPDNVRAILPTRNQDSRGGLLYPEDRARLIQNAKDSGRMVREPAKGSVSEWFRRKPQTWDTPEQLAADAAYRRRMVGE